MTLYRGPSEFYDNSSGSHGRVKAPDLATERRKSAHLIERAKKLAKVIDVKPTLSIKARAAAPKPEIPPEVQQTSWTITTSATPTGRVISMASLACLVSHLSGVAVNDLKSPRRGVKAVQARQVFMMLARKYTIRSLPEIGRFMNRDHSTVLYAIRSVEGCPDKFEPLLSACLKELGGKP